LQLKLAKPFRQLVSGLVADVFGTRYMATLLGISFVMHQGSSLKLYGAPARGSQLVADSQIRLFFGRSLRHCCREQLIS
jgi:hypothetical protein